MVWFLQRIVRRSHVAPPFGRAAHPTGNRSRKGHFEETSIPDAGLPKPDLLQDLSRSVKGVHAPDSPQTNLSASIEPFGEIHRIANTDLVRVHLIGPHFEIGESCLSVDRGECSIHRIQAMGELDAAGAWHIKASIEGIPPVAQIDFAISVEILGMI